MIIHKFIYQNLIINYLKCIRIKVKQIIHKYTLSNIINYFFFRGKLRDT